MMPMPKDSIAQPSDLVRPRHVGMPIRRTEDPRLLTGNGEYSADRKPDRALHVAFRRSSESHALIVRVEVSQAKAAPGVIDVLTADDVAGDFKPVIPFSRMANYYATPILPLAAGKVRYVGEAIAAVIAESRYLAEDAVELIDIEYEPLGAVSDPERNLVPGAPLLHEEAGTNVLIAREFKKGDVKSDLAGAHVRVRDRFRMTRKAPLAMEPRSYSAEYESRYDSLTLYTSSNVPGIVRDALSDSLDLAGSRFRVVAPDVGGSFGSKGSLYPEEILLCIAAKKLRRSVKWTADRLEDISSSSQAFAEIVDAEMGFDVDGVAVGLEADVIGDVGAYSIYPWTSGLETVQVVSFLPGPYKIRSYRGAVRGVATSKPPTGPYRGVGRPISTFVAERLMDMGARALGIDPLEIRRRNLVRAEEFPYRIASGIIWDRTGFLECLEAAAKAADYEKLRELQQVARAEGRYVGIGIASYAELTGIGSRIAVAPGMPINTGSETAKICVDSTGAITAAFGVASHGQGLETTLAQIIADDLGAKFEDIHVIQGDSDAGADVDRNLCEPERGAGRRRRQARIPPVAREDQARRIASARGGRRRYRCLRRPCMGRWNRPLRHVQADRQGRLLGHEDASGRGARGTRSELYLRPDQRHDCRRHPSGHGRNRPATCFVKILKYVVAEDCGRIINPMIVDGQVHGGVAQGIGAALYEEIIYDDDGQLLSAQPRRLHHPVRRRSAGDGRRPHRKQNPRWPADFAAWAKVARSAHPPRSLTRSPTRSRHSASTYRSCRRRRNGYSGSWSNRPTNRKEIDDE